MAIRFLLDENVHGGIARGLARRGIQVETVVGLGWESEADLTILERAHVEGLVVVTHDDDFLRLGGKGRSHSGLCYCHAEKYTVGRLLELLVLVYECLDIEELRDHIEYL